MDSSGRSEKAEMGRIGAQEVTGFVEMVYIEFFPLPKPERLTRGF